MSWLAIAIGGTLGCWLRYGQTLGVQSMFGRQFPAATLSINVIGSFLMGFLFIATAERFAIGQPLRVGILTGFLGGFTTFSAFSVEIMLLIQDGEPGKGAVYAVSSVALGLIACFIGAVIARAI